MTVLYRTGESVSLTSAQASAWLGYVQGIFGAQATSQSIVRVMINRPPGRKFIAELTIKRSGSADAYAAALDSHRASELLSYGGGTAVWTESVIAPAIDIDAAMVTLLAQCHTGVAPGHVRSVRLERGSPSTSAIRYNAEISAHDWATAEAAGNPPGRFVGVV